MILYFIAINSYGQAGIDTSIIKSKGTWSDPVVKILRIDTAGPCNYPCDLPSYAVRIITDSSQLVRFIQAGRVRMVTYIGDAYAVIVEKNESFLIYSGLNAVSVKKDDYVENGQTIGSLLESYDGFYELEIGFTYGGKTEKRLQDWFTESFRERARSLR